MSKGFSNLGLNEHLQQGLTDLQISVPTDIQKKTIPIVLNQKRRRCCLSKNRIGKNGRFWIALTAVD